MTSTGNHKFTVTLISARFRLFTDLLCLCERKEKKNNSSREYHPLFFDRYDQH